MELTVSIASHGQNAMLAPLLEQLHALSETMPMCVIVTENIPDQQIHYPTSDTFVVRWNGNTRPKGFGANHNAAFAMCGTPYFLVLNPDIRIAANANLHALIPLLRVRWKLSISVCRTCATPPGARLSCAPTMSA